MTVASDQAMMRNGQPGHAAASARRGVSPAVYFRWKGLIGRMLAMLLLIPGLPIIGILVVLVRLTSRGPGIYRQVRVGQDGRNFDMFKIRTMHCDAEIKRGPQWTQERDPRITRLGFWLRKFHFDEFPQLFNVLRGEMNIIGPRPERPEFVQVLAKAIPGYLERLSVPPGITGLAQINLPPDTDVDSVRRKLVLDLEYVESASVFLDLRMFASTLLRMFGLSGDRAMRLMQLQRNVTLSEAASETSCANVSTPENLIQDPSPEPTSVNGSSPENGAPNAHWSNRKIRSST